MSFDCEPSNDCWTPPQKKEIKEKKINNDDNDKNNNNNRNNNSNNHNTDNNDDTYLVVCLSCPFEAIQKVATPGQINKLSFCAHGLII